MGFLRDEDYEDLPENDWEAFSLLESISRDRLHAVERDRDGDFGYFDAMRYMNEVSAIADEFKVPGISFDNEPNNYRAEFASFTLAVDYRLAQIRIQRARRLKKNSVAITGPARTRIQHHLEQLKEEITKSALPEKRKKALLDKIAEFETDLAGKRLNLALAMTLFALVITASHDFQEMLIDAPKTVALITGIIGKEKISEEEQALLPQAPKPMKALPDMRKKAANARTSDDDWGGGTNAKGGFADDLDDDVPF